jgi:hypothetical protein
VRRTNRKIITEFTFPPIPTTKFDYISYFEGEEESGLRGNGATKKESIESLKRAESQEEEQ